MSENYRVQVTVTKVQREETTKDRYDKVITTGTNRDTEVLKGTYLLPTVHESSLSQKVTDFLSTLSAFPVSPLREELDRLISGPGNHPDLMP